jgi:adenosylcobinamide-phosphate synthase
VLALLAVALAVEAAFGYPSLLDRAIGHPVAWIGALIAWLDRVLNAAGTGSRLRGVLALLITLVAAVLPAAALQILLCRLLPPFVAPAVLGVLAATLLASRNLFDHVRAVQTALAARGLAGGREAVARIVGRDPDRLDEAGVRRAAIESLAENFSDAVVAPALWCGLFGLPGIALYKAANTADSMLGHRTPRYARFGWAAARFDDLINLPASRLAAFWIVLAALLDRPGRAHAAFRAAVRDAPRHRSPNAGWPEGAMAGALGLRLAGPRIYGGIRVEDAWMGEGRGEPTQADLSLALALYGRACAVQIAAVLVLALVTGA